MARRTALKLHRYSDAPILGAPDRGEWLPFSNSERDDSTCPLRWWYRHVERLATQSTRPTRLGTLWHAILEELHVWWMRTAGSPWKPQAWATCPYDHAKPCDRCGGTGHGIGARLRNGLFQEVANARERGISFTEEEASGLLDTVGRMFDGWLRTYGLECPHGLRVVGVEIAVARQIVNHATGRPYLPELDVVRFPDGSAEIAGTGQASGQEPIPEGTKIETVRMPVFQVSRWDAVFLEEKSGGLFLGEWKSSADPAGLVNDLNVDPQTQGYLWIADQPAVLAHFGAKHVQGYVYDVTSSSYQYDPEPLKGRPTKANPNPPLVFSKASNRNTPSWRYLATLRRNGIDPSEYQDHIDHLEATIDRKLYRREVAYRAPDSEAKRYEIEAFAAAQRLVGFRRGVARAETVEDLISTVPRVAVCKLPGASCSYRGPCVADGEAVRRNFDVLPGLRWEPEPDPQAELPIGPQRPG